VRYKILKTKIKNLLPARFAACSLACEKGCGTASNRLIF
jgi:hypothetical protein